MTELLVMCTISYVDLDRRRIHVPSEVRKYVLLSIQFLSYHNQGAGCECYN